MFYRMAAANASARGQRAAIVASPLHDLTGFYLAVDCLAPGCGGERSYAVADWRASAAAIARSATWCAGCAVPAAGGARGGGLAGNGANTQRQSPRPTCAATRTGGAALN